MIERCLSFGLICLLLLSINSGLVSAQTITDNATAPIAKIKASVLKRGIGENKRVSVKMLNGTKIKGYISQAGEDSFTLVDSDTRQSTVVAYRDVEKVGSSGLSKGAKIAIGVSIAAAATLTVIYIAFQNAIKDN